MKKHQKFITIIFISLIFTFNMAHSQTVITTQGDTITENIKSILGRKINYYRDIEKIDTDEILLENVSEIIGLKRDSRINSVHRSNPYVLIKKDFNDTGFRAINTSADFTNKSISKLNTVSLNLPSGKYLQRAGNRYFTGIAFTLAGSAVTVLGATESNDELMLLGGATSLAGFVIYLTGHSQLIKAGKKLNIELNSNGLALKF